MNAADIKQAARAELDRGARLNLTDRKVCMSNLRFVYHIIRATEELLFDAERMSEGELRDYYTAHRSEEKSHAEWLESDLDGDTGKADMLCAAMVGAMFYLVRYVDPCALLGYQLVLECFSMPIDYLEVLERVHGEKLLRTLRHHAVHDIDHGAKVMEQIDKLPEDRRPIVRKSALHTARCVAAASHSFA